METAIMALVVAGAGLWLVLYFRNAAKGKCGCPGCGKCPKPACGGRPPESRQEM